MSIGRYRPISQDLHEANEEAARARKSKARANADILQARLDQLTLATEAMWSLLREKLALTDEDLRQRMIDLDLSDGELDGVARREPQICGNCARTTPRRAPRCIYCGHATEMDPFAF
ncbi:MAG: hypothetical protein SF069_13275 [Phycisphaerae bacterium]|nr:hypothetical protein [Phycisphaerae bacterium]